MELIDCVMGLFGRTLADILFLVGDNAPTNRTLTRFQDNEIVEVSTTSSSYADLVELSRRINNEKLISIYLGYHQLLTMRNDCLAKQNVSWEITAKNLTQ